MTTCPFCHIFLDKSGKHFCTALREPQVTQPQETKVAVFSCSECAYESGNKEEIVAHHKTAHVQKPELERIIEVLAWAHEKGALHFKCPYFEMVFPAKNPNAPTAELPKPDVIDDNRRAEEGLTQKVPFQNPIDDPDYYADAQERFYNHQPTINRG